MDPGTLNLASWLRDGGPWALLVLAGVAIVYLWNALNKQRDSSEAILREWHSDSRTIITKMTDAITKYSESLHNFSGEIDESVSELEKSVREAKESVAKQGERLWRIETLLNNQSTTMGKRHDVTPPE